MSDTGHEIHSTSPGNGFVCLGNIDTLCTGADTLGSTPKKDVADKPADMTRTDRGTRDRLSIAVHCRLLLLSCGVAKCICIDELNVRDLP